MGVAEQAERAADATRRLAWLRRLGERLREGVSAGLRAESIERLASATGERGGDVIYRLDEHGETALFAVCEEWAREEPFLLVAEGLEQGQRTFPAGADPHRLAFTLIVDPIDGTRGLMYGKRSAWALLGIAPAPRAGHWPTLADITLALQAELPTPRAALADTLWAQAGQGAQGETRDLRTGATTPFTPRPSAATTLAGGFASMVKFFPGVKAQTATLEEAMFEELLGPPPADAPQVFDDQYISSGGQLAELMLGHDRFVADLRPLLAAPGQTVSLSAHPYDLGAELIAREAGVIVTDPWGRPLAAPLDTHTPVAWVGYANTTLRDTIAPILHRLLRERLGAEPR
ncbi:MAG TPA: inositol monophosphatase [Ktedonobacterales bacterium]|nr:inositol monophosphatase [Ktedonobacterales bacterium]